MKRLSLFVFIALAAFPAYAGLSDLAADRAAIKALYVRMAKAMKERDARATQSVMTDVSTIDGKTMTVKQSMAMMKSVLAQMTKVNACKYEVKTCEISGKTAKVTEDYSVSFEMMEKGKLHKMISKGTNSDTLIKTRKGWRIKTITTMHDETTMDGKKIGKAAGTPGEVH